jgi:beta-phosphoglucomutase-like phosphatase (HAD superfamily)
MNINFYDWDDTIVFTRTAQFYSYRESIKFHLDYDLEWNMFNEKFYGNSNVFLAAMGCNDSEIKLIRKMKSELYLNKYFDQIEVLVKDFEEDSINVIVSNTTEKTILGLIERLNIPSVFEFIVASDSYHGANRKPAPDLYHFAFSKLKNFSCTTDLLTIYEDSYEGAFSALTFIKQANIQNSKLIFMPCPHVRGHDLNMHIDALEYYPKITKVK